MQKTVINYNEIFFQHQMIAESDHSAAVSITFTHKSPPNIKRFECAKKAKSGNSSLTETFSFSRSENTRRDYSAI
jgi:hypothetical protein